MQECPIADGSQPRTLSFLIVAPLFWPFVFGSTEENPAFWVPDGRLGFSISPWWYDVSCCSCFSLDHELVCLFAVELSPTFAWLSLDRHSLDPIPTASPAETTPLYGLRDEQRSHAGMPAQPPEQLRSADPTNPPQKPFTAVTVSIESLTSETYEEEDLSGIPELVEVITLQASGPTEAARAIRKKLKYGNVHRQLRALVILDGLIQNAGGRFQRCFCDEALLERLRVCGTAGTSHPEVKKKCNELFRSWAQFKGTEGMKGVASLYKVGGGLLPSFGVRRVWYWC